MIDTERNRNFVHHKLLLILLLVAVYSCTLRRIQASTSQQTTVVDSDTLTYTGIVQYITGIPVEDIEVSVGIPFSEGLHVLNSTTTNSLGCYHLETPIVYPYYYLLIIHDSNETAGLDWIPVYYKIGRSTKHQNITSILEPAATVIITGPYRSIMQSNPSISYSIHDENNEVIHIYDKKLHFGYASEYTQILNYNESTLIIPADKAFRISSPFFSIPHLDGETLQLRQGQLAYIDIRKYALQNDTSNFQYYLDEISELISDYQNMGYYGAYESTQYSTAVNHYNASLEYNRLEDYDQSFIQLKYSYMQLQNIESLINENISEASESIVPSLLFFAVTALSLSNLFSGKSKRKYFVSATIITLFYALFYLVFPGKDLISPTILIFYGVVSLASAIVLVNIIKYVLKMGRKGGIGLYDALSASFSLASSNLKRRRLRSILVFLTVLVISMSFISLTSFSVLYGLVQREQILTYSSGKGVMMRMPEYVSPYKPGNPEYSTDDGTFNPIGEGTLSWLVSNYGVDGVSPKAESQPGRRLPLIGFEPGEEPLIHAIDDVTVVGEKLRTSGICLIHEDRIGRAEKGDIIQVGVHPNVVYLDVYDLGDTIMGLEIVGGFSNDISDIRDIDGSSILPLKIVLKDVSKDGQVRFQAVPYSAEEVIITTIDDALTRGCKVSRANLVIGEGYDVNIVVQTLAMATNYRFWSFNDGRIIYTVMGEIVEGKGASLFVPYGIVVLTVISTMLGSLHERRKEINILSSVGLNPGHISSIFLAESSILGFSAGSLGYLLGMAMYQVMSFMSFAPNVRQKISSDWIFATLGLSISSVLIGTLLALRYSISLTPSLRRKWRIQDEVKPEALDHWAVDLPTKINDARICDFISYIENSLRKLIPDQQEISRSLSLGVLYVKVRKDIEDGRHDIRFFHKLDEKSYTRNDITLIKTGGEYNLSLYTIGNQSGAEYVGRLMRKLVMEWSVEIGEILPYSRSMG